MRNKDKDKDKEEEAQSAVMALLSTPPPPAAQSNAPAAPAGSQHPLAPIINVYKQPSNMNWQRKPPERGQRRRGRFNPGFRGVCWGCG